MDYQTLNLLFRCNKEFSHSKIRPRELTDTEYMICSCIFSHENRSQDDVVSALKADKTTVAKALASLEKKGCVIRTQDDTDKRVKRLRLTAAGREKIADLNEYRVADRCGRPDLGPADRRRAFPRHRYFHAFRKDQTYGFL